MLRHLHEGVLLLLLRRPARLLHKLLAHALTIHFLPDTCSAARVILRLTRRLAHLHRPHRRPPTHLRTPACRHEAPIFYLVLENLDLMVGLRLIGISLQVAGFHS